MELDDIVRAVKEYYQRLWCDQANSATSPTIPNFNRPRLDGLAAQLGVPREVVRRAFGTVVRELRDDLENSFAGSRAPLSGEM